MQKLRSFTVALGFLILIFFPLLRIASHVAGHYLLSTEAFILSLAVLLLLGGIIAQKDNKAQRAE